MKLISFSKLADDGKDLKKIDGFQIRYQHLIKLRIIDATNVC